MSKQNQESRDTGIPTRAIHESYLNMQAAHRQFRQARDDPSVDETAAHADFQDAVLTFYELIRPHLKHETALEKYWAGNVPDYTGWDFNSEREAAAYLQDRGTGIYQIQRHTDVVELEQQALTDGGLSTFDEWHRTLGLSWDSERLFAIGREEKHVYLKFFRLAVLPLRELDQWRVRVTQQRAHGDGFMAGETRTERRREFEPSLKLVTAKRLLVEAADTLGALSAFDASTQRTEITREDIKKVEEWHQNQVN